MANLNLSEFGEKLFVTDADHTFIWDTANAISKRVSRNSWLNSGTLTSDAPVTISQTWNGTSSTVFTAFKINAASTASDPTSKLLDLQLGGVSKFSVEKGTNVIFRNNCLLFEAFGAGTSGLNCIAQENYTFRRGELGTNRVLFNPLGVYVTNSSVFGFSSTNDATGAADTILVRDGAANTLALRNGEAPQTFRVYNTYSAGGVNFERLNIQWSGGAARIFPDAGGTGTLKTVYLGSDSVANNAFLVNGASNLVQINTSGAERMRITSAGNVGIGTTSPTSKLHVAGDVTLPNGGSIFFGGGFNIYGTTTSTTINGPTAFGILNVASNGVTKWTFNYDGLLCGGGTTAAFPALKRSSTTMQARLADDTAFAPIQGKLTTDTAFTATTVTPTGFITLYDSTGTAYKVPCVQA